MSDAPAAAVTSETVVSTGMAVTSYKTTGPLRARCGEGPRFVRRSLPLDLRLLTGGGSYALSAIGYEAAIETGTTIEHHATIDPAAALYRNSNHLLTAQRDRSSHGARPASPDGRGVEC